MDDYFLEPDFYAQVMITIQGQAHVLANPRLARVAAQSMTECAPDAPGQLWGYVVLPEAIKFIVGPTNDEQLESYIDRVKTHTGQHLLKCILRADDDSLDAVVFYNPVRGGIIFQVWQTGSHRVTFWTEYKLSNALYALRQAPVAAGLVADADAWHYRSIYANDEI